MRTRIVTIIILLILGCTTWGYAAPGQPDTSFNTTGTAQTPSFSGRANSLARQTSDGKLIVAGSRAATASANEFALLRYTVNGTLDPAFGSNGQVSTPIGISAEAMAVGLQSTGRIVAAGYSTDGSYDTITLVRYTATGAVDTTFGSGGTGIVKTAVTATSGSRALAMVIDSSNRIIVAGYDTSSGFVVARYTSSGLTDTTFGTPHTGIVTDTLIGSSDQATCLALQADGKIIVGVTNPAGTAGIARYTSGGSLDPAFNFTGKVQVNFNASGAAIQALAIQPDGSILAAGARTAGGSDIAVARLTGTGGIDSQFGSGGVVATDISGGNDRAFGVAVQKNDRIVVAGSSINTFTSTEQFVVARYESTGMPDSGFGSNGTVVTGVNGASTSQATGVLVQPDGRIVTAGFLNNGSDSFALTRLTGDITVTFAAGLHGSVSGTLVQTADAGGNTTAVQAVADPGYHFVQWVDSNGVVYNTSYLQLSGLTADLTVTAAFAADPVVTFSAGLHGSITGTLVQTVPLNGSTTQVTAVADPNYHFVSWNGPNGFTSTSPQLIVSNVTADMTFTATFAIDTRTLQFVAATGGSISGTTLQTVNYGASSTPVTAVPATGFSFVTWTGPAAFTPTAANPLTVANVTGDMTITATFRDIAPPVITSFTLPATSTGQYVTPVTVTATDNTAVTGYCLSEDNTPPTPLSPCWTATVPAGFTVAGTGLRTVYLWARDGVGNMTASRYASVTIQDTTPPNVTAFPDNVSFTTPFQVTLTASGAATIHYTTDGSTPTAASPVYAGPISISTTTALNYLARDTTGNSSPVKTGIYQSDLTPLTAVPINGTSAVRGAGRLRISSTYAVDHTLMAEFYNSGTRISNDSGLTWTALGLPGDSSWHTDFSPAFATDNTIFAAHYQGTILRSTDRGNSWQVLGTIPDSITELRVSPDYLNDRTLFAFGNTTSYRSVDGGATWIPMHEFTAYTQRSAFSPAYATDGMMLAATTRGLLLSNDRGNSWNTVFNAYAYTAAIAPGGMLLASFGDMGLTGRIYYSTDGGSTWSYWTGPSLTLDIKVSPEFATDKTVALAASGGIMKCVNLGQSCTYVYPGTLPVVGMNVNSIAFSASYATNRQIFATTSYEGVIRSLNGGTTWSLMDNGLPNVNEIDVSPAFAVDQTLFRAEGGTRQLSRSSNGGQTWVDLPYLPSPPDKVLLSPGYASDRTLIASVAGGAYKSSDGGSTWSKITLPNLTSYSGRRILFSPGYATDRTLFSYNSGISLSTDGGATWNAVGSFGSYISSMAASPAYTTDRTLFVAEQVYNAGINAYQINLHRSTDSGVSWSIVNSQLGWGGAGIFPSPDFIHDRTVVMLTYDTSYRPVLLKTTDAGSTWSVLPQPAAAGMTVGVISFVFSPDYATDSAMFVGNWFGLYRSQDKGASWQYVPIAMDAAPVRITTVYSVTPSPAFASDRTLFIISSYGTFKMVMPSAGIPAVTSFSVPATSTTTTVGPVILTGTDNLAVTGYCIREVNDPAGCSWSGTPPTSFTVSSLGNKTLYAWVRDASGAASRPATASVTVGNLLTLTVAGTGSGSVSGTLPCASGTCSAAYAGGTALAETATPAPGSFFAGWSGACTGTGGCTATLNASGYLVAAFTENRNVRNLTSGETFLPLQDAYDAAPSGSTIQARALTFSENLLLNRPVTVTIKGGYDAVYATAAGRSTVQGKVVIQAGRLTLDGVTVR